MYPSGRELSRSRTTWRSRRLTRCRTTELPTALLTMNPTFAWSPGPLTSPSTYITSLRVPVFRPRRTTMPKCSAATSRAAAGSMAATPDQADSRDRPLRLRAATMARPARVRIRVRNPWVRARRRLFGWKVRLPLVTATLLPIVPANMLDLDLRVSMSAAEASAQAVRGTTYEHATVRIAVRSPDRHAESRRPVESTRYHMTSCRRTLQVRTRPRLPARPSQQRTISTRSGLISTRCLVMKEQPCYRSSLVVRAVATEITEGRAATRTVRAQRYEPCHGSCGPHDGRRWHDAQLWISLWMLSSFARLRRVHLVRTR